MKKLSSLFLVLVLLFSCNTEDESNLSNDKIVGEWNLTSQIVDGTEIADDCTKQTVFNFQSDRVLTQTFYSFSSNTCTAGSQIASSWFFSGNSKYRIERTNSTSTILELTFSENETKFSVSETNSDDVTTVSTFTKI